MQKMKSIRIWNKRRWSRALAAALAAVLWMEGGCGAVYAIEPAAAGDPAVYAPKEPETEAEDTVNDGEKEPTAGESPGAGGETPEEGDSPGAGEEKPGEEETPGADGEKPEEGDSPGAGEEETPEEGEKPGAGGEETPEEGEKPGAGGETPEEGETPGAGEETPEEGETPGAGEKEPLPEPVETVSGNTPDTVPEEPSEEESLEEPLYEGGSVLGEPPLAIEGFGGAKGLSYSGADFMAGAEGLTRQTPSAAQIIARYEAYPWNLTTENTYSDKPSTKSPYKAGHLTGKSLENALNLLNFIRYVAGIPADVTLDEEYIKKNQAGSLINCINGQLSHTPDKPEGFTTDEETELYELGKSGCSSSNIASGYGNIARSLLDGWMYDGDSSNIDRMGHRRWVLNPAMTKTGFGAVGAYSSMYAFDRSGSSVTDFVAWPAQTMPIELMNGSGTPWTVSLGSDYKEVDLDKVSVTLRDVSGNKTWTFSKLNANGYFKVNTDYYGMPNCIIFRPNGVSYNKTSRFQVTIKGLTDQDGEETSLSYYVNLFSLSDKPEEPEEVTEVTLNKQKLHLLTGQQDTLLATVKPDNAVNRSLTWRTGNEAVAKVDAQGKVEAVGVGATEISATAANGVQAVCTVKVSDYTLVSDAPGFQFDKETMTGSLSFDLKTDMTAKKLVVMDGSLESTDKIEWTSDDGNVASVAGGTVTPTGIGETVIWASVDDGFHVLACEVRVEDSALPTISLREDTVTLHRRKNQEGSLEGDTRQLKVYLTPADSRWKKVKWKSDNAAVAALVLDDGQTAAEVSGSSTVLVRATGEGTTKITAVITDDDGKDVVIDGKRAEAVCTVTVKREAELQEKDIPIPVALINTQTTLRDVALPVGWSFKYPDTALSQFAGMRSKKFAAVYMPEGAGSDTVPAETLLEVCFLHVENISVKLRTEEGKEYTDSVLCQGQKVKCYVNYSFDDALRRFENDEKYGGNVYFKEQKEKLLGELEKGITWSSGNAGVLLVQSALDGAECTAKGIGSATVKGSLKLGKKTFGASLKLTVSGKADALAVASVEGFRKSGQADGVYVGELSAFRTERANQINSKIALTLPGASKVTAKSGNAKVVAVKSQAAEGNGFVVSLIVKAAGTAQITVTGNDAGKTSHTITLIVADAEPGLSEELITVNTKRNTGAEVVVYPASNPDGGVYAVTGVTMDSDDQSAQFILTGGGTAGSYKIMAKSGTKSGSYKTKLLATADKKTYALPLTIKVESKIPVYKVKQESKLNLFYKESKSRLFIETDEQVKSVTLTGCADYTVEGQNGIYYVKAKEGASLNSVKTGSLQIAFTGYQEPVTARFTVAVEKKAPKISLESGGVTFYPNAGISSVRIGFKNADHLFGSSLEKIGLSTGAKGNYEVKADNELSEQQPVRGIILSGKNLNQAESFKAVVSLRDKTWTESVNISCSIKVNLGMPSIALGKKTLQLNANDAYKDYDAAQTTVRWKGGGDILPDKDVRVSVLYDARDMSAGTLVRGGRVAFSVDKETSCIKVSARLNNKDVDPGSYKFTVQVSHKGKSWKTPLTLKVVNTASAQAVKVSAKGSIDVLNREGSFMTLTPSLKAVGGEITGVFLKGRDAHLFEAEWDGNDGKIKLRAKRSVPGNEITLVAKYQYSVIPVLTLRNVRGETNQAEAPEVKFKVKQGSVKVSASPKSARMYSGAYNSVEVTLKASLKGAKEPAIERVSLAGNSDVFSIAGWDSETGKVTLAMTRSGHAVKGKSYTLKLQVWLADQADNIKPVTVRYTVKVK